MDKSGHLIVGFISAAIFIVCMHYFASWYDFSDYKIIIIALLVIPLYSLLPDIDHESGTITWYFLGASIIGAVAGAFIPNKLLLYYSLSLLVMTFIAVKFTHHRGVIHTIWVGALAAVPLGFIFNWQIAAVGFVAFYSHLCADGLPFKTLP